MGPRSFLPSPQTAMATEVQLPATMNAVVVQEVRLFLVSYHCRYRRLFPRPKPLLWRKSLCRHSAITNSLSRSNTRLQTQPTGSVRLAPRIQSPPG